MFRLQIWSVYRKFTPNWLFTEPITLTTVPRQTWHRRRDAALHDFTKPDKTPHICIRRMRQIENQNFVKSMVKSGMHWSGHLLFCCSCFAFFYFQLLHQRKRSTQLHCSLSRAARTKILRHIFRVRGRKLVFWTIQWWQRLPIDCKGPFPASQRYLKSE